MLNSNKRLLPLFYLQTCMLFSTLYHAMNCCSYSACCVWLSRDILGISMAFFGIFISGIYYGFWCNEVTAFKVSCDLSSKFTQFSTSLNVSSINSIKFKWGSQWCTWDYWKLNVFWLKNSFFYLVENGCILFIPQCIQI